MSNYIYDSVQQCINTSRKMSIVPTRTKVFREMKWAEELGSGKKNIKKFAPLYYEEYKIEIQNNEKFIFSITYKDVDEASNEKEKDSRTQAGPKQDSNRDQATKRPSNQANAK
jgi:ATP-dependent DNA helicase RecG